MPKKIQKCENCGKDDGNLREITPTGLFQEEEAPEIWCKKCRTFWPCNYLHK